jgi:hypothetical protein
MSKIPESHVDLLDKPAFAHVATLMKDGSPQVTPCGSTARATRSSSTAPPAA